MEKWWEQLSGFQQTMFVIAVTATIILFIFLILMIIGIDHSVDGIDGAGDVDVSGIDVFNHEPMTDIGELRLVTFRGVLAFLGVGGWVAFILDDSMKAIFAGLIGLVCGSIAAFLLALFFKFITRLEREGNLDYRYAIGKSGVVYIKVPKNRNGKGKVNLTIQDRYIEADAVTDDGEDLRTNASVDVIGLADESTLIVKKSA